jgi:hypothetical protein
MCETIQEMKWTFKELETFEKVAVSIIAVMVSGIAIFSIGLLVFSALK